MRYFLWIQGFYLRIKLKQRETDYIVYELNVHLKLSFVI